MIERRCVYTVLTHGAEELREQPVAYESDLDFIAFIGADPDADVDVESDTWEVRRFTNLFAGDDRRAQKVFKLCAHHALPDVDLSMYLDNTITLVRPPEALLALVPFDAGLAACPAPAPTTAAAFADVARAGVARERDLREQWNDYRAHHTEALQRRHFSAELMVRRHHRGDVIEGTERWLAHVLRYTGHDQLSQQIALSQFGLDHFAFPFTVHDNDYVRRPDRSTRDDGMSRVGFGSPCDLSGPSEEQRLQAAADQSTEQLAAMDAAIATLRADLGVFEQDDGRKRELIRLHQRIGAIEASTSWRATSAIRGLLDKVRGR